MPELPKLLIVDDEAPQMQALCDTLSDHGYATVGVGTGEAAMEQLRVAKFDLVLSDLMMPGMDGIAFLRAALATDPELVGIIMTGQGSISTAVEAMKEGALDYILKPFRVSTVLPVLSRALEVRRLRLENASLHRGLIERTEALEAANQSLDAFAISVAHDLQTPARHIAGYANLMVSHHSAELSPEALRHLQVIEGAGERMVRLISDLLAFSRLGRAELRRVPVDLGALAERVWNELKVQRELLETAADREQTFVWKASGLPVVRADEAMLRQVFTNLISNAVKYTRGRTPAEIEIGASQEAGAVLVFIRDNGVGFDMKHAGNLFGIFKRLHSAEQFEGNGVGLANVRRIIQRHGGRVWAEAEVGKGATFYFTLPG